MSFFPLCYRIFHDMPASSKATHGFHNIGIQLIDPWRNLLLQAAASIHTFYPFAIASLLGITLGIYCLVHPQMFLLSFDRVYGSTSMALYSLSNRCTLSWVNKDFTQYRYLHSDRLLMMRWLGNRKLQPIIMLSDVNGANEGGSAKNRCQLLSKNLTHNNNPNTGFQPC